MKQLKNDPVHKKMMQTIAKDAIVGNGHFDPEEAF
jgi:hypothetical protein